jgi:membrane protein YdbS with pleckstrin-like domain
MPAPSFHKLGPTEKGPLVRISVASGLWLIAAAVAGHFAWEGVPWIVVVLLAAMAELLALTVWLIGSTFNDPVKRWDLPPNPADAQKGWRGKLAVVRSTAGGMGRGLRQKLLRRPAKV